MKFRKKPVVIEAHQWFKNGDHPEDDAYAMFMYPTGPNPNDYVERPHVIREGKVVKRYNARISKTGKPEDLEPDMSACVHCGTPMFTHGWIKTLKGGHIVCSGDWVITGVKGERYPCKPDIFAETYEAVEQ